MEVEKNKYYIQKELGSGSFGYVFMALDQQDNKFAIKRTKKKSNVLSREIEILKEIKDCKHCVKMIECFYTFENQQLI